MNPHASALPHLLSIVGSPRRDGNCDALTAEATSTAVAAGATAEIIHLNDLTLHPCSACNGCRVESAGRRRCVVDDDMQPLYDKLAGCDGPLIATPVYWWGPSAQTKLFVDRWYGVTDRRATFAGKPLGIIVASGSGSPAMADHVLGPFRSIANYLGMPWAGEVLVSGKAVGQALDDRRSAAKAADLGRRLRELAARR